MGHQPGRPHDRGPPGGARLAAPPACRVAATSKQGVVSAEVKQEWVAEPGIDWDDEYANGPYIPSGDDYPRRWAGAAAEFRPRHGVDLFHPEGDSRGLVVFVHGGYWMQFDKSTWSHLATGPVANGWTVALPGYVLAPEAGIGDISRQVAAACELLGGRSDGPLALTGHSAGGQIVTRLVSRPNLLSRAVIDRVQNVVSISGVHDLRPLLLTSMNATLALTNDEAEAEPATTRSGCGSSPTATTLT